jgi:cytochrome c-type biogenesis protein
LPLIPAYISFVAGVSLKELTGETVTKEAKRAAIVHSIFFILGFSFVFVVLGASASLLGGIFYDYLDWITRLGGVLIILFGCHLTGIFQLKFLQSDKHVRVSNKKYGYLGSLLIGVAFGAGWTPCVGPILGSILVLASTQESVGRGIVLLSFYSAGIGIPLFLATLGLNAFMNPTL